MQKEDQTNLIIKKSSTTNIYISTFKYKLYAYKVSEDE